MEELAVGSVFGDYEICEELGRGGMGCVYRARHRTLDRDVALKVLTDQFSQDEAFRQRFLREARAAARLNHPNIVQIYDFGKVGQVHYLAMELVRGRSLGYHLAHSGRFPESDAVTIVRHACHALGVAHEAGLVHRDVKPDNLIMTQAGLVKLVDLGLAKRLDDDQSLSQTGFSAGTPHYISPEQIEGRKDIDGRADIYSLGATLFHLMTGHTPFSGPSPMAIVAQHLRDPVPDPRRFLPELSEGVCRVTLRMMARDREQRYSDVFALDEGQLYRLQTGGVVSTAPPAVNVPTPPEDRRLMDSPAPMTTPPGWDRALLQQVEEHLAAAIGPLARVFVRQVARTSYDLRDLGLRLAEQIPGEAEKSAFLSAVARVAGAAAASGSRIGSSAAISVVRQSSMMPPPPPGGTTVVWDDAALRSAEQHLAAVIGPVAKVVIRKAARQARSWDELVAVLVAELPGEPERQALRAALGSVGR